MESTETSQASHHYWNHLVHLAVHQSKHTLLSSLPVWSSLYIRMVGGFWNNIYLLSIHTIQYVCMKFLAGGFLLSVKLSIITGRNIYDGALIFKMECHHDTMWEKMCWNFFHAHNKPTTLLSSVFNIQDVYNISNKISWWQLEGSLLNLVHM